MTSPIRTRGRAAWPALAVLLLGIVAGVATAQEASDPQPTAEIEAERPSQGSEDAGEPEGPAEPEPTPVASEQPPAEPERPVSWAPPEPSATEFDWIQVDSGEWIKGELELLRRRKIYFDSDKFDDQTLDWPDDVVVFVLPRIKTYRFEGRRVLRGTGEMRGDVIRIRSEEGIVYEFDRRELVAITMGTGDEIDRWSASIGVGITGRRGNTETTDITATGAIARETALNRWYTTYSGNYSKNKDEKTANNHRVVSVVNQYLTPRVFLDAPFVEFLNDEFSNIDIRLTPGVALGYDVIVRPKAEWSVSFGPAYQYTKIDEVSGNQDDTSHDFALVYKTSAEFDLPGGTDFDNEYRLQVVTTDIDKTNHYLESVISFDIWGPLDLDVSFIFDRIENPESDGKGNRPKRNDYRLVFGFSIDL